MKRLLCFLLPLLSAGLVQAVPLVAFQPEQTVVEPDIRPGRLLMDFTLTLSEPAPADCSFGIRFPAGTMAGEATLNRDWQPSESLDAFGHQGVTFNVLTGRMTFIQGVTTALVRFFIAPDLIEEGTETFRVALHSQQGCTLEHDHFKVTITESAPGWFAAVNSTDVRLLRPNGALWAFTIPPGSPAGVNYGPRPSVALYDLDYDNLPELILGSDSGTGREAFAGIYSMNPTESTPFYRYRDEIRPYPGFLNGCHVAAGRVTTQPSPCVVTGARAGGSPHVKIYRFVPSWRDGFRDVLGGQITTPVRDYFALYGGDFLAYDAAMSAGVRVACGDVDGDGLDDIITVTGPGVPVQVKVFRGGDFALILDYLPYGGFTGSAQISAGDWNGDGRAEIVTSADAPGGTHIRMFNAASSTWTYDFHAFNNATPDGGVRAVILPRPAAVTPGGPAENRMFYSLHAYSSGGVIASSIGAPDVQTVTYPVFNSASGALTWSMSAWQGYRPKPFSYSLSAGGLLTVNGDPHAFYRLWYLPDLQPPGPDPITGFSFNWRPVEFFQPDRSGSYTRQFVLPYLGQSRGFFKVTCQNNYDWQGFTTLGD